MPLDDAPQIQIKDRIFQAFFRLVGREPKTFSLLHRLLLTASHLVLWDGEKSVWARGDSEGRLVLAPITMGVTIPAEPTVLLSDAFEGGFAWQISGTGTDFIGERRAEALFQGDYGLYLQPRVTGAAADDTVKAVRSMPFPSQPKVAKFHRFNTPILAYNKYIDFIFRVYDETGKWVAVIRWDQIAQVWQYLDRVGAFQTIPGIPPTTWSGVWYSMELEIDVKDHSYGKLRFFGEEIDLSNIEFCQDLPGVYSRYLEVEFEITASSADRPVLYVDDVLVRDVL